MASENPADGADTSKREGALTATVNANLASPAQAPASLPQPPSHKDWSTLESLLRGASADQALPLDGKTALALTCLAALIAFLAAAPLAVLCANLVTRLDHPERALPVFNLVLKVLPKDTAAGCGRAGAYCCQGRYSDALADLNKILTGNPGSVEARSMRADILSFLHFDRQANSDLMVLRRTAPEQAIQFQKRSYEAVYAQGDTGEIIRLANLALTIDADLPQAYADLAWGYLRRGQYGLAIDAASSGLALKPAENTIVAALYLVRAEALGALEKFDLAAADARASLRADSKVKPYRCLTLYYMASGRYADALAAIEEAKNRVDVRDIVLRFLTRVIYLKTNDPRVESTPRSSKFNCIKASEYMLDRADMFMEGKNFKQAETCIQLALIATPNKANILLARGRIYAGMDKYEQALSDFDQCLKIRPGLAHGYFFRSQVEEACGQQLAAARDRKAAADLGFKPAGNAYIHVIQDYLP